MALTYLGNKSGGLRFSLDHPHSRNFLLRVSHREHQPQVGLQTEVDISFGLR